MDKILRELNKEYDERRKQRKEDTMVILFNVLSFIGGLAMFTWFLSCLM